MSELGFTHSAKRFIEKPFRIRKGGSQFFGIFGSLDWTLGEGGYICLMPEKSQDYGARTSVLIPDDVRKLIQRSRIAFRQRYGYTPSRSALMIMILRGFLKQPDWLNKILDKGATNGQ